MRSSDTTQEIRIPVDEMLSRASLDVTILANRIKRQSKQMPAGAVQQAVNDVIIRLVAQAEVLKAQSDEVAEHWPDKPDVDL